jgi:hypothetical protein
MYVMGTSLSVLRYFPICFNLLRHIVKVALAISFIVFPCFQKFALQR